MHMKKPITDIEFLIPVLKKIYSSNGNDISLQINRYTRLIDAFKEKFGEREFHFFSTPGRTEIGGNHTDHNNGRVLASSVDLDSVAVASYSNSNRVTLFSEGYQEAFIVNLDDLNKKEQEKGSTVALIRGIAGGFKSRGHQVGGFNAFISSDVLPGSGLSSSASIEVLIGSIFNVLYNNEKITAEELAKIGQYAENAFFDKPCGLMDQLACAVGGIITIDFKNSAEPQTKKIHFDFAKEKYRLLVVNSGGSHADLTDDYAAIPNEMQAVAKLFDKNNCRELSDEILKTQTGKIRETLGDRHLLRVMHFKEENERVLKQVTALEEDRFSDFLEHVRESGNSSFKWLQNVYSNSNINDQGVSVALAFTEDFISRCGEGACRVHGGGFAGTIQTFLPANMVSEYIELMESVFGSGSVKVLKIRPQGTLYLNSV
jgi:galactokinase